jgi:hypothetical protein
MKSDKEKIDLEETDKEHISEDLFVIDGELLEIKDEDIEIVDEEETQVSPKKFEKIGTPKTTDQKPKTNNSKHYLQYLVLPFIFLTVTLLGGLRIGIENSELLFFRPALICLIFGALLLVLFFRANLIKLDGWLNEKFTTERNIINGLIIFTLWTASTQVFNSLIPEQGLPFWVFSFCFFWTLWNNLLAEFDTRRLLQSLGGLFALAFVVKYLVLVNFVAGETDSWRDFFSAKQITKEAFSYLLDLPKFSGGTGYIQFFTLVFYLIGLFLLKPGAEK